MYEDYIAHEGVSILDGAPGRGSGRYPLGSGKNPYQRPADFLTRVEKLKSEGKSESHIARELGYIDYREKRSRLKAEGKTPEEVEALLYLPDEKDHVNTTRYRAALAVEKHAERAVKVARARELQSQGLSLRQIAAEMGYPSDSSVRTLLNEDAARRKEETIHIADKLREEVDKYGMVDVGKGVANQLNITETRLEEACYILEEAGYHIYGGRQPQVTNKGQMTTLKVLAKPDVPYKDIYDYGKVHIIDDYISHDNGNTLEKFIYPSSMDPSRLMVRYGDEGGEAKDGLVEIRRGVADLSLGDSHYSQVRILVGGTHYIKGMAVYSDGEDMPDGVDIIFNTNKKSGTPIMGPKDSTVLKPIKKDPEDPFGSLIKAPSQGGQSYYIDPDTGEKKLSLINKRADEGDWDDWSNKIPSQFLAKQPVALIERQLDLSRERTKSEFDEICSLTNPTVKKNLLYSFADSCDGTATSLKAAALPGQKYKVILPLTSIKDNEIYAPHLENGTKVALVRYPHGGTFEIPICRVNNKNAEGNNTITKQAKDAVGINKKVADQLSGADFDGDTVMVIPVRDTRETAEGLKKPLTRGDIDIVSRPALPGLEGFDPKLQYGGKAPDTFKHMKKGRQVQTEMGIISNLIMDMTLMGASDEELAAAVRHSMVVIDAEKHGLDYKQSEKDNHIAELKKKYQGHYDENGKYHEGAATLITRAGKETEVLKRKGSARIDKETGELIIKEVEEHYTDKNGKDRIRTQKVSMMSTVDDARELMSENKTANVKEIKYADYANFMKDMASQARIIVAQNEKIEYSPQAAKTYASEVDHLKIQLNEALKNKPRERRAQGIANQRVKEKEDMYKSQGLQKEDYKDDLKKFSQKALTAARYEVGSKRYEVTISDKEWEAIQAGAVSETTLKQLLEHANPDRVKELALPRSSKTITSAQRTRIHNLARSGYTTAEIAEAVRLSASTVSGILGEKEA